MEIFDIVDEQGRPTGETVERSKAHAEGILHRTAHVWIMRIKEGRPQVILQKRSPHKDSFPDCWDTSSAGHITASQSPVDSAVRELEEELGIRIRKEELKEAGKIRISYEETFYGSLFKDEEIAFIYVYEADPDLYSLKLQKEEVSEVCWYDLYELKERTERNDRRYCADLKSIRALVSYFENSRK